MHKISALPILLLLGLLPLLSAAVHAEAIQVQATQDEQALDAAAQKAALASIKGAFDRHPCVRAKLVKKVDDPLGLMPSVEQGELLVKRPDRILRRYFKNDVPQKAVLLQGTNSLTYNPATKLIQVKDYAQAPRYLQLMRAGGTGDMETLQLYYDLKVFEKTGSKPRQWRLLLEHRRGPLPYKRIQARVTEEQPFFSEIVYEYGNAADGDNKTETFTEIAALADLPDKAFDDPMLRGAKEPPEAVQEIEKE
ncbi:MAG: hypothetical protein HS116_28855 [Planctomycetes bacterium]|nr:hypothetical protein [Planctomycetota bacterium]